MGEGGEGSRVTAQAGGEAAAAAVCFRGRLPNRAASSAHPLKNNVGQQMSPELHHCKCSVSKAEVSHSPSQLNLRA